MLSQSSFPVACLFNEACHLSGIQNSSASFTAGNRELAKQRYYMVVSTAALVITSSNWL